MAKNHGIGYTNIAHQGAQGARKARPVPNPPGGVVHDFVPFYYAPRSPMLYAINGGRVAGCNLAQGDILHFEFLLPDIVDPNTQFVIYDRNATLTYARAYTALTDLDKVAWDLLFESPLVGDFAKYFHDRPSVPRHADRLEKRMAEFLVKGRVELTSCLRIGVINEAQKQQAIQTLEHAGLRVPVNVRPDWYF